MALVVNVGPLLQDAVASTLETVSIIWLGEALAPALGIHRVAAALIVGVLARFILTGILATLSSHVGDEEDEEPKPRKPPEPPQEPPGVAA